MITTYEGPVLSVGLATALVNPEYVLAWRWFVANEGRAVSRPYGKTMPAEASVPWSAQRGIHKPAGQPYALSISSVGNSTYVDSVSKLDDGTWVFDYCAHRRNAGETAGSPEYNWSLVRCLHDGIPVGVLTRGEGGRTVCRGLAFVERFNDETGMFTLHGPVRMDTAFELVTPAELHDAKRELQRAKDGLAPGRNGNAWITEALINEYELSQDDDERERRLVEMVRRKKQAGFRRALIRAYEGRCAMSGYDAVDALQAAHISSYFGPKSQRVTNGLLLRADLHILFDRNVLGINPQTMKVELGPTLANTRYRSFDGRKLRMPRDKRLRPSEERLAAQYAAFRQAQEADE